MAQKDTQLLAEILSVQKAIFAKQERGEKEGKKGGGGGEGGSAAKVEEQSFTGMIKELGELNKTSKEQLRVLQDIKKAVGGSGTSGGGVAAPKGAGGMKEIGKGLLSFGLGMIALVGGIAAMALVAPLVPIALLSAIGIGIIIYGFFKLFESLGADNTEGMVQAGIANLWSMSKAIALFTLAVAITGLALMAIGLKPIITVALTITAFYGLFWILGKGADTVKDGAKAIMWMGIGMAALGLGVWALVYGLGKAGEIMGSSGGSVIAGGIAALGIIAVAGLIFYILGTGKIASSVAMGALAVTAIAIGLAIFGMGLTFYLSGIAKVMGVGGGAAGGTKVTGGFFDTLGSMLVGLGVIAVGAITLMLYGTIFALAGMFEVGVPLMIALGAAAFAATGIGLLFFGFGLDYYLGVIKKNIGVSGEGSEQSINKDSFTSGIATMGGAVGMLIGIGVIFALAGAVSPIILLGAAAFAATGLSLMALGKGISAFAEKVPTGTDISIALKTNLTGIRDAFLAFIGEEDLAEKGFLGAVGGAITGGIKGAGLAKAIAAARQLGPVLSSIAFGISTWANLQNIPKVKGYDQLGQPIFAEGETANIDTALKNITEYLPKIVQPFIDVSTQAKLSQNNVNVLSLLTGASLGSSPFERGISASARIGPTLTSIASGVGAWAHLQKIPLIKGYDELGKPIFDSTKTANIETAIENIGKVLKIDSPTSVLKPFIDVSKEALLGKPTSLFSLISGGDLGSSPFEQGISASARIGNVLTTLASGVGSWVNLQNIPLIKGYDKQGKPIFDSTKTANIVTAIENISKVLKIDSPTSVLKPFIELSQKALLGKPTSLFSLISGADLGSSPFEIGISASSRIGNALTTLASGVGSWAHLKNIPLIKGYDELGKPIFDSTKTADIGTAIENINKVLKIDSPTSILKPFIDLSRSALLNKPVNLFSLISGASFGESPFEIGISASSRIGNVLSSLAMGVGSFMSLTNIKKITGYDDLENPIFDTSSQIDIEAAIKNIGDILSIDGTNSVIKPFIALAEHAALTEPFAIGSWIKKAITGSTGGNSPLVKGISMGVQIGEIVSNISKGIGQMGNLAAVTVINGYDENGRPTYSEPVDATASVKNFGIIIGDLVKAFAEAGEKSAPFGGNNSEAIGPMIAGIVGAIVEGLDVFSNPNKLKMISGYDADGKAIYYTDRFVDIDTVTRNMTDTVLQIIRALGTDEIDDAMDELDIEGQGMLIGGFLQQFVQPLQGFRNLVGSLGGGDMRGFIRDVIYSTVGLINEFSYIDNSAIRQTEDAGEAIKQLGIDVLGAYRSLEKFDKINPTFYITDLNVSGSALRGISDNIGYSIATIAGAFAPHPSEPQLETAKDGSKIVLKILKNMRWFPKYMEIFLKAKPKAFGLGAQAAFDGLFSITKVAEKGEGKGVTHMKLFTDQINRLSDVAGPFEKFTKSFGRMSKDMKIFAENFSLMDEDGIFAFQKWTRSIINLSTANPTTFAKNIVTPNKAIDLAYKTEGVGTSGTSGPSFVEKGIAVVKGALGNPNKKDKKDSGKIDTKALASAVSSAVITALRSGISVTIDGVSPNVKIYKV